MLKRTAIASCTSPCQHTMYGMPAASSVLPSSTELHAFKNTNSTVPPDLTKVAKLLHWTACGRCGLPLDAKWCASNSTSPLTFVCPEMCTTATFFCSKDDDVSLKSSASGCGCTCTSTGLYGKSKVRTICCASWCTWIFETPFAENTAMPRVLGPPPFPSSRRGRLSKSARVSNAFSGSVRSSFAQAPSEGTEKDSGVAEGFLHTCSKTASMCVPSGNRFFASLASATLRKSPTASPTQASRRGIWAVRMLFLRTASLPAKGRFPSSISKYTTPAAHTSISNSDSSPLICSNEAYSNVPSKPASLESSFFEVPKSTMTTLLQPSPLPRSMMLAGLMSRWMIFFSCSTLNPRSSPCITHSVSLGGRRLSALPARRASSRALRFCPSINSMTTALGSTNSTNSTTFCCTIGLCSAWRLSTSSFTRLLSRKKILIANCFPSPFFARHTVPCAPLSKGSKSSYPSDFSVAVLSAKAADECGADGRVTAPLFAEPPVKLVLVWSRSRSAKN
mmetsp:Transcript_41896/g.99351  ORF Transcript_41896/g.99351 Transcript_41896/m.99351 type:complete len:506 (-) Transcript_41896:802-2319(-)